MGVLVGDEVLVVVTVGVGVINGVIVGVGVGVEFIQFKQNGFKKLYLGFNILALC